MGEMGTLGDVLWRIDLSTLVSYSRLVLRVRQIIKLAKIGILTLYESCFAIIWKVNVCPVAFWKYDANLLSSPWSWTHRQPCTLRSASPPLSFAGRLR